MSRRSCGIAFILLLGCTASVPAQEPERGKVKKVDVDKLTITLIQKDKDRQFVVDAETRTPDFKGTLKERLKGFKPGDTVMFKPRESRDEVPPLWGIKLVGAGAPAGAGTPPPLVNPDTKHLKPLTELGTQEYQGFQGGLYPGGKNERPAAHEAAGLAFAKQVRPLDADGKPSPDGKIVILSVGMSNTGQASNGFAKALGRDREHIPNVQFVDGAVGGMTASRIQNPSAPDGAKYWEAVDQRLKAAGVTRAQVQATWIKEADAGPSEGFPGYAKKLEGELKRVVQLLPGRFPNCKLVYLSSRTYGGYARTKLNPEPYAYESGFSVRWLIEEQIKGSPDVNYDPKKGEVRAPWLSWGPYLWANGSTKRPDGFAYEQSDFSPSDGTHLSGTGVEKVGRLMLDFFKSDSTTRPWFTR
jgi:hypothetical protein